MMTMIEGTSIELGDPIPEVAPEIQIETPEERLMTLFLLTSSTNSHDMIFNAISNRIKTHSHYSSTCQ